MNIREKIAKIIAKAKSTDNEAEAEMFLAKAMQLMEEHQIGAHELGDSSDPIGMVQGVTAQAGPPMYKYEVYRVVANYYGCKTFRRHIPLGKTFVMEVIGPLSATVTAELMGEFVWEQLTAMSRKQAKELGINSGAQLRKLCNAFGSRVWGEIHARVKADRVTDGPRNAAAASNALVLQDAVKAFYDNFYASVNIQMVGQKARSSNEAARTGAAGISLHRQTGGSATLRIGK